MRVLITRTIPRAGIELLRKHPSLELDYRQGAPLSTKELIDGIKDADAIIAVIPDKITREILLSAPKLKIVAHYAVGYDNIDIAAASEMGIYVSNTPGDLTEAVAEHALALMLSVGRQIPLADKFTRAGEYKFWDPMIFLGPRFGGKTLGLVGFGRIAKHLAKLAKNGFGMRILYNDVQRDEALEKDLGAMFVSLDDLLGESDFVSIHVPLLPSTKHLITDRELRKMKPTAYLINTARGPIVDEDSLILALQEKWIEGAAIDVFEEEPNIRTELKQLDNVVLTPHIGSATREARIEMSRMVAENILEVLISKKPPINLVNKDIKNVRV
ncbi:D-glycerate dehydrogenase [candidate division WWE3 bacterium]|nr:D-glycerate dehydrogenase [candidate division WWE3 bacterium]